MKSGGPSKYPLKVIIGVWIIVIFGVNPCGSLGRDRRAVVYLAYLTSRAELSFSFSRFMFVVLYHFRKIIFFVMQAFSINST